MAAAELVRVLRPGGRLGLCSWTPDGNVGEYFRLLAAQLPPAPGPAPTMWGSEQHLRGLFGSTGLQLEFDREVVVLRFDSVEQAVCPYETKFGPVISARERLEPEGRWAPVREELAAMFRAHNESTDGTVAYAGEYYLREALSRLGGPPGAVFGWGLLVYDWRETGTPHARSFAVRGSGPRAPVFRDHTRKRNNEHLRRRHQLARSSAARLARRHWGVVPGERSRFFIASRWRLVAA